MPSLINERDQQIERARAQWYRHTLFQKLSLAELELERSETAALGQRWNGHYQEIVSNGKLYAANDDPGRPEGLVGSRLPFAHGLRPEGLVGSRLPFAHGLRFFIWICGLNRTKSSPFLQSDSEDTRQFLGVHIALMQGVVGAVALVGVGESDPLGGRTLNSLTYSV
jgi:hypothetical protein